MFDHDIRVDSKDFFHGTHISSSDSDYDPSDDDEDTDLAKQNKKKR